MAAHELLSHFTAFCHVAVRGRVVDSLRFLSRQDDERLLDCETDERAAPLIIITVLIEFSVHNYFITVNTFTRRYRYRHRLSLPFIMLLRANIFADVAHF